MNERLAQLQVSEETYDETQTALPLSMRGCGGRTKKGTLCKNIGVYPDASVPPCHFCTMHVPKLTGERCTICLCVLFDMLSMEPCKHVFHRRCILRWFRKSCSKVKTCPVCRQHVQHMRRAFPALRAVHGVRDPGDLDREEDVRHDNGCDEGDGPAHAGSGARAPPLYDGLVLDLFEQGPQTV
eukprot:466198-Prorocentrum_minimum.AAC.30